MFCSAEEYAAYREALEQTHRKYFERLSAADADPRFQQLELNLSGSPEPAAKA